MIGDKMIRPSDLNRMIYDEMFGNEIIYHQSSVDLLKQGMIKKRAEYKMI